MTSVEIDREACEGSRYCEGVAADIFRLGEDEKAEVLKDPIPEEQLGLVEEAESLCPTFAIRRRAAARGGDSPA
ncbi:MAG TPA: ferredoxin [Solirubrobacterales bacterium]|jgi:ferredoxin